jgi:hypothetical protein
LPDHAPPTSRATRNALFAIQPSADRSQTRLKNPFADTIRQTVEPDADPSEPVGLEVFAGAGATLAAHHDEATGCCAYLWGLAAHPEVSKADLLPWIVRTLLVDGDVKELTNLVGHFLFILDDRRAGRVHFITDIFAMRPAFVGQRDGRLVLGSDVWALHEAGLSGGEVDYESVGAFIYHVYDCTGGTVFKGLRRLPHSSVVTWERGHFKSTSYLDYKIGNTEVPREEMAERVHQCVSRDFDALMEGVDDVTLALSGGFDSRYLAALAVRKPGLRITSYVVANDPSEATVARQVADALSLKLQVIPADGTSWNMYDEPYHFMADGFPVTKQVGHLVATRRPGMPILNGFMGDSTVRGANDRWYDKTDQETTDDLAAVLFRAYDSRGNRLDLLHDGVVRRVHEAGMRPLHAWVEKGRAYGKPFPYIMWFNKHAFLVANNFLQHLDHAEAVMPLCTPSLFGLRFAHGYQTFNWDLYNYILGSRFPELANLPHNTKLQKGPRPRPPVSRCSKRWAAGLVNALTNPASGGMLSLVNRRKAIPRLLGVIAGRRDVEPVARFLKRLWLLERRLRRASVPFDWNGI